MSLLYSLIQGAIVSAINQKMQADYSARKLAERSQFSKKTSGSPFRDSTSSKNSWTDLNDDYIYLADKGGIMKK